MLNTKPRTKKYYLLIVAILWALSSFVLYWFGRNFTNNGDLAHAVPFLLSLTVFGLTTITLIKWIQYKLISQDNVAKIKMQERDTELIQSQEELTDTMNKTLEKIKSSNDSMPIQQESKTEDFIFIKAEGKIYKVLFDNLLFAEANGNNTRIVLENNTIQPTMTFGNLEAQLPRKIFFRLHRSYIINKSKISHIEGNRVFVGKTEIPIGSNYREEFLKELGV